MDWNLAIERQGLALRGVLATLAGMAGLAEDSKTLPRRLHRFILRLLRPAEAAARRLILVAARELLVRPALPQASAGDTSAAIAAGGRTGIVIVAARGLGLASMAPSARERPRKPSRFLLPLAETLRGLPRPARRTTAVLPRITTFGSEMHGRHPLRRSPAPDDPLDATRLRGRLLAITGVLDELPRHVNRFLRWQARRERALAQGRLHRLGTLRPGRPPGWKNPGSRRADPVHSVLDELHGLAAWALQPRDTS